MTIVFSTSIPERDRNYIKQIITAISPDTRYLALSKKPEEIILVVRGWHNPTLLTQGGYEPPHFNIRYPPTHMFGGRDMHVYVVRNVNEYGEEYYTPFIT